MFPVIMYDGNTPLPEDEPIFYIIAKGGIYMYKDLNTVRSMTKVDAISFLKEVKGFAELKIPIIPKEIIAEAVGYLRHVYSECHSEGGLILHLFPETGEYKLHCPVQEVSNGSVKWDNEKEHIPDGAIRVCSIHSHGAGSAFHSSIDKEDEKNFDGLHITLGHMGEEIHSIMASIVVNGNRFKLDEEEISSYIDINIIPIGGDITIVQTKKECNRVYEDYQPVLGNHNLCDITSPVSTKLKKWKGYTTTKTGYTSDERRFTLDVSEYNFLDEWKSKFTFKTPKIYRWDSKLGKLVETKSYSSYYTGNYGCGYNGKEYDWSRWTDDKDDISKYSYMNNKLKDDSVKYLPPPKDGCKVHPITGNCDKCLYKELAMDAVDQGLFDNNDVLDYLNAGYTECGEDNDPIGMDDIPDCNEYYGSHVGEEDLGQYDLHYDAKGNMVNTDGDVVEVMSKEDQEYLDTILSSKDVIDHQ